MTIEIWEGFEPEAENSKKTSGKAVYWVTGTDVEADAITAVMAVAPVTVDCGGKLAIRTSVQARRRGVQFWEVPVQYSDEDDEKSKEDPEEGDYLFKFDTTGGTHKITQSISTIERYYRTSANPAPDLRGAIGWDGKKLNGTEIVVPKLEFTLDIYYAPASITTTFAATLARNTGKHNDGDWLHFHECEVLFLGATGQGQYALLSGSKVKPTKITFKFACSENRTDITLGDIGLNSAGAGITGIAKKGWEYLWVYYTIKDSIDGIAYPTPEWAYVEKVYRSMNFATFFGVGP